MGPLQNGPGPGVEDAATGAALVVQDRVAVTAVDTPAVPPSADAAFAPQLSAKDRSLRHKLEGLLADNGHNLAALARALGKDRTQIYRWVRRLGISRGTRK